MPNHRFTLIAFVLTGALALAACGSSGSKTPAASGTTPTTVHVALSARNTPSKSAKMICESEVEDDINKQIVGLKTIQPLSPTWKDHVYSCRYVYRGGVLTLSVKELSNKAQTDAYFASMAKKYGKTQNINGLGQGAFTTKNDSAVVRKDYKVLLVDISGLPAQFGSPPDSRGDVALNVAATIMGCWTGA